jgi:hypothetical protein
MANADDTWQDDPSAPNNGPRTNVIVWSLTALATAFLGLRVFCKIKKHRGLWWDDWFLVASWVSDISNILPLNIDSALPIVHTKYIVSS